MEKEQIKFRWNNEEATFNISRSMMQIGEVQTTSIRSHKVESTSELQIEERLGV